jgi:hypothetical protein
MGRACSTNGVEEELNSRYTAPAWTAQKTSLSLLRVLSLPEKKNMSTELFPSNGCRTIYTAVTWQWVYTLKRVVHIVSTGL